MRAKYIYEKFEEESDPIKDMGLSGPLRHLVVRGGRGHRDIYLLLGLTSDGYWMHVFRAGVINWRYGKSEEYASFIFNTKENNEIMIKSVKEYPESYRKPTDNEINLMKIALKEPINQKYLDIIEEKTGIDLRK